MKKYLKIWLGGRPYSLKTEIITFPNVCRVDEFLFVKETVVVKGIISR